MTETRGRMTIKPAGDSTLELGGSIDETAQVIDLVARARGGKLVLDMSAVAFINSLGVRDWIRMQAAMTSANVELELRRVSEPVVHQLNMIIATRGTSAITSFYAPYACDACGREDSLLIDAVAHHDKLVHLEAPPMTCPECAAPMVFNDFPERYFSFVTG